MSRTISVPELDIIKLEPSLHVLSVFRKHAVTTNETEKMKTTKY